MKLKIEQRGNVWWGFWTAKGQRHRESSGTTDEVLAREIITKLYAASFREKVLGEKPRRTWAEATERYLEEHEALRTYDEYEKKSEWWTAQFQARKVSYLDEITPDLVKDIRKWWMTVPKQRGGGKRGAADVNRYIAYLRAVVNAAYREYRWFQTGEEPPLYRFQPGEVSRLRFLQPDEVDALVAALPHPYGVAARFAVATGLRRRNVLRLTWDQVNFDAKTATIEGMHMKNGELLKIPLNAKAIAVLKSQANNSDYVFLKETGAIAREIPSKVWKKACKEAGLTNLRWHDLRHTWASLMRQQGVELELIRELGGWKSLAMVERYAHINIDHLRDAAAVIDRLFGEDSETPEPTRPKLSVVAGTDLTQRQSSRPPLQVVNG